MEKVEREIEKRKRVVSFSSSSSSFHRAAGVDNTSSTTETKLSQRPSVFPFSFILLLHAIRSSTVSISASSRSVSLGASSSPQDSIEAAAAAKTRGVDQVMS